MAKETKDEATTRTRKPLSGLDAADIAKLARLVDECAAKERADASVTEDELMRTFGLKAKLAKIAETRTQE
jgi:hypothetical protein